MAEQRRFETLVGTIVGAHGIQGTTKVKFATQTSLMMIAPAPRPSDTAPRPTVDVWVGTSPDDGRVLKVVSAKKQEPKEIYLVKFVEASDRNSADALIGSKIFVPDDRRPPLDRDEYFVNDLLGLAVVTEAGRDLGKVIEVIPNPANDVYETDSGAMVPAVKEFVKKIDLKSGRIVVRDVAGLVPDEQEEVGGQETSGETSPEPVEIEPDADETTAVAKIGRRRFGAKR